MDYKKLEHNSNWHSDLVEFLEDSDNTGELIHVVKAIRAMHTRDKYFMADNIPESELVNAFKIADGRIARKIGEEVYVHQRLGGRKSRISKITELLELANKAFFSLNIGMALYYMRKVEKQFARSTVYQALKNLS